MSHCLIHLVQPSTVSFISVWEWHWFLFQSPRWQFSAGRTCLWRRGVWSTWRARWPGPPRPRPPPPGVTTTASSHSEDPDLGSPSSSTRARSPRPSCSSCRPGTWSWWRRSSEVLRSPHCTILISDPATPACTRVSQIMPRLPMSPFTSSQV